RFRLRLRIPAWAQGAEARVGEATAASVEPGRYLELEREWRDGEVVALSLPMRARVHRRGYRNVQESRSPDGSAVRQLVRQHRYVAFSRGPLAYATGLVDGYRDREVVRLTEDDAAVRIETLADPAGGPAPVLRLHPAERPALDFQPY